MPVDEDVAEGPTGGKPDAGPALDNIHEIYHSQTHALLTGIQAFVPSLEALHKDFQEEQFPDWPTVLLATILQTTAVSLFKLLPPPKPTQEAIDRRSIATLIRNLIDTHDALDLFCNPASPGEFNLHRDILGRYLAGRTDTVRRQLAPLEAGDTYENISARYWEKIERALPDPKQRNRLKSGEGIFYRTRMERIQKACGADAEFVRAVLTDLSTYVHSVPPVLWFSSLDAFDDTRDTRANLTVWVQIANFYYASSIRIINRAAGPEPSEDLAKYLQRFESVFKR